jgi:Family of unknown function (DUF6228)
MDTLTVGAPPGPVAVFHSRRYASSGWLELYSLELRTLDFSASTTVENPGFGHPPSQLFDELASHWKGWSGAKDWHAAEGELQIRATSDSTGHITLSFVIPMSGSFRPWSAEVRLLVEAGETEALANESHAFFGNGNA